MFNRFWDNFSLVGGFVVLQCNINAQLQCEIFSFMFTSQKSIFPSLTFHSPVCSTAGGLCSSRSRWVCSDTRRTWRRSRARSARSRAARSGPRWETRSPRTPLPLLCNLDLVKARQRADAEIKWADKSQPTWEVFGMNLNLYSWKFPASRSRKKLGKRCRSFLPCIYSTWFQMTFIQ